MSHTQNPLSRRAILKGVGVTMFLPLLEAMQPKPASANERQLAEKPPVRMAVLYMANGVNPHAWTPAGIGHDFALSEILAPLASVKSELLVFSELMNHQSIEGDGHYVKVAPFLTGTHITRTTGSNLRCGGVSLDQAVAQHVGNQTPLPSLELSIEPVTSYVDTNVGYTALYGSHISWSTPTTPVSREINPQMAFDRLFRSHAAPGKVSRLQDVSILDAVMADARSLKAKVGQADRNKLEEYFESVRSVEKRIAFDGSRRRAERMEDPAMRGEVDKLGQRIHDWYALPDNVNGHNINHTEQVRLMLDIIALAFWTDSTRVATFMFANEVSGKNFSFLPGVNGGHHQISHHDNKKDALEQYKKINIWHMQQYAYLLEKLKGIQEANGTVLDNAMVMLGSGMQDGNAHSPYNLPIVLAGRAGGTLATGRHIAYAPETKLCNLYRGMMTRMGMPVETIGDSTEELPGLSDPTYAGVKPKA